MMPNTSFSIESLRRALWHLRKGGLGQLQDHLRRIRSQTGPQGVVEEVRRGGMPSWTIPVPIIDGRDSLTVGTILDPFSEMAFQYEWTQVPLHLHNWKERLAKSPIDLLFVESAWEGSGGSWRYKLVGKNAPSQELNDLVTYCKNLGIPTVFWNKEDPSHFDDFIDTAALFDFVYTTDVNRISSYLERLGSVNIGLLPFAAQPAIHNPIRPPKWNEESLRGIAFGGTYFRHKYPERRIQLDILLKGALRASEYTGESLDIYSRNETIDEKYRFPDEYREHIAGSLTYPQMLTAYRMYKIFLNANSVVDSPSMCARRIFEITACGTSVVSSGGIAIPNFFTDGIITEVKTEDEAYNASRSLLSSSELRRHRVHVGQREIWKSHTYTHRVNQILSDTGLEQYRRSLPTVSVLISTNRPQYLETILRQMRNQQDVEAQLLVLTHGFAPTATEKRALEDKNGSITWLHATSDKSLGHCYNRLVDAADGEVVAKIDDDDLYSSHYLFDQLNAMNYASAPIVGKGSYHTYIESENLTVLRFPDNELKYRDFVAGATLVIDRDVASGLEFSDVTGGEDTDLLRRASHQQIPIFSSDRFGFLNLRRTSRDHTWTIDNSTILASGRVVGYGCLQDHVLF